MKVALIPFIEAPSELVTDSIREADALNFDDFTIEIGFFHVDGDVILNGF